MCARRKELQGANREKQERRTRSAEPRSSRQPNKHREECAMPGKKETETKRVRTEYEDRNDAKGRNVKTIPTLSAARTTQKHPKTAQKSSSDEKRAPRKPHHGANQDASTKNRREGFGKGEQAKPPNASSYIHTSHWSTKFDKQRRYMRANIESLNHRHRPSTTALDCTPIGGSSARAPVI